MGDPVTTALIVATAASTGLGVISAIRTGGVAASEYEYREAVGRQEAEFQKKKTEIELERHKENLKKVLGRQAVVAGGSGAVPSSGTPLSIMGETARQAEIDEQIIKLTGDINVWRALAGAELYGSQAGEFRTAGFLEAGTTLLNAAPMFDYRSSESLLANPGATKRPIRDKFGIGPGY